MKALAIITLLSFFLIVLWATIRSSRKKKQVESTKLDEPQYSYSSSKLHEDSDDKKDDEDDDDSSDDEDDSNDDEERCSFCGGEGHTLGGCTMFIACISCG